MTTLTDLGFIDALAATVALLTSLVGLLVAVDRISIRFRMQRTEAWATAAVARESDNDRRRVLELIATRATAGLVGRHLVPSHHFAAAMLPALIVWATASRNVFDDSLPDAALAAIGYLPLIAIAIRRTIRLATKRAAVVASFIQGGAPIREPRLRLIDQMEGGTRREFALAWLLAGALLVLSVGVALVLTGRHLLGVVLTLLAIGGLMWGLESIRDYIERTAIVEQG